MQEVEAVCQRVIIINRGKIATDKDVANIDEIMEDEFHYFEFEFDQIVSEDELKSITGVTKVTTSTNGFWVIEAKKETDIRPALSKWAVTKEITILTMKKSETSLEQVFHKVTRKKG